jgi:endonuclease G
MTGTLYEEDMLTLPKGDEEHMVPSAFWKIVTVNSSGSVMVAAFIMDQDSDSDVNYKDSLVTVQEVEERSDLIFFWYEGLTGAEGNEIKTQMMESWVNRWK